MDKGIVVAPIVVEATEKDFSISCKLDKEKLNFYVLYWNDIVIPTNNLLHFKIPDEELLISQNIIRRPSVGLSKIGGDGGKSVLEAQAIVAESLMGMEPGKWVFMQDGKRLQLSDNHSELRSNITLDLTNIMPSPPKDTPLEEILEFKFKRKDELSQLWYYLDELCLQVQREPDRALAQRLIIDDLGKAIEDAMKVNKEAWRLLKLSNFKVSLSLDYKNLLSGGVTEFITSQIPSLNTTIPHGIAALFGIAISTVKVSADVSLAPKVPKSPEQMKLSYLSQLSTQIYM